MRHVFVLFRTCMLSTLFALSVVQGCVDEGGGSDGETVSTQRRFIINGTKDTRHPAAGAIVFNGSPFCTATLIAKRVVLTAAHCVDPIKNFYSRVGDVFFRIDMPDSTQPDGYKEHLFKINTSLLFNHPNWNGDYVSGNDIAIVILEKEVTITPTIPYNVKALDQTLVGQKLLFLGYGYIQSVPTVIQAGRKYAADLPITSLSSLHLESYAPTQGICHGDSGGPVLMEVDGVLRVVAVNSYGVGNRAPGYPPRLECKGKGYSLRTDPYTRFLTPLLTKYGDIAPPCKTDQDCGSCAVCNTKSTCVYKPAVTSPKACLPCRVDSDCGTGGVCTRLAEGYRCLQPCSSNGCCPTGSACGRAGDVSSPQVCLLEKPVCPPVSCQKDDDCGLGEVCDATAKTCKPPDIPKSKSLCFPCQTHADCGGGGTFCIGAQGFGRCTQPCAKGGFCPLGYTCKELYPGIPQQCVPVNGACELSCQAASDCPTDFECKAGFCVRKGGFLEGESCSASTCKSPMKCVGTSSGRKCLFDCGIPKGQPGTTCATDNDCMQGTHCKVGEAGDKVCLASCGSAFECEAFYGGVCRDKLCQCTGSSDCGADGVCSIPEGKAFGACVSLTARYRCQQGQRCLAVADKGEYCRSQGDKRLGEPCEHVLDCKAGLRCMKSDAGSICVEECTTSKTCTFGGKCLDVGNATQPLALCFCKSGEKECPSSRACQLFFHNTYGVCLAEDGTKGCLSDNECPTGYTCKNSSCVADDTEKSGEKASEPPRELVVDAGVKDESKPKKDTLPPTYRPDIKPERTILDQTKPEGCSCAASPFEYGQLPFGMLCVLLFFGWGCLKRRR
ncbi:MAG: hypothetical protein CL920_27660 [Deltaproteobacteria bacterium]|nr:hypothetical protein [Deltaproteobacteria bacterium]MBU52489.1 hypothetical protein [Deltaproteobacteria bacterium]